ncbi:hypothetical protein [Acinetobacter sp. F16]|uniref:hypothetical protein n=1 Tax=Acinetobacter sp. F16 TaxID=3462438 RepID=UPI004046B52C
MKKYPLLNYMGSYAQELLYETSNSALLGIPEALKNATQKIYTQAKLNNEALYSFQVRTFLETLDLDEDEISKFMQDNPNHQRLGLEIFKILENTLLEKQAKMSAKAFKLYVIKECSREELDKYFYIITKISRHLVLIIDHLSKLPKLPNDNFVKCSDGQIGYKKASDLIENANLELVSFDFIRPIINLDPESDVRDPTKYFITPYFYNFYENIFKD